MNTRVSTELAPRKHRVPCRSRLRPAISSPRKTALPFSVPGEGSPARRQAPHARSDQLEGVARGVAEVEGMAAVRPGFLVFDRHLVLLEPLPPGVEVLGRDAQGEMARSAGAMRRQMSTPKRRLGPEHQQHVAIPDLEEDVPPCFLTPDPQTEYVAKEPLGLVEIVGVNPCLHKALNRF